MWPDKETNIDYLNFEYLVDLIVEIALNRDLTPSTIGLYGDWGSGKSSLMKIAKERIEKLSEQKNDENKFPKTLCIEFNGWLFEGYEDTKTSLCGTILDTLADKEKFGSEVADKAKELIKKIDFKKLLGKGIKFGFDYFLTGGIGALTDLTLSNIFSSLKSKVDGVEAQEIEAFLSKLKNDEKNRTEIKKFRNEFNDLLKKSKVENVVVFIDELDRCNPDTILDVFEAMRLFLFVDGMSFIIGADERLIQYAIKTKYKEVPGNNLDIGKEYLEKVIQYPITIPQLNQAEVNQYLACLLLERTLEDGEFNKFLNVIHGIGLDKELTMELLDEKAAIIAGKCKGDISLAKEISSVLAPSINGNPRQCKRFLNTLMMRLSLANSRDITLDKNILAKLMLAEYFNPEFFKTITKPENRDAFKAFESNTDNSEETIFNIWKDNEWVKTWMHNGTIIGDEKIDKYVYFSNIKNCYSHSKLNLLRPIAKECFDKLKDGTDSHRKNALKQVKELTSIEKSIISSELFEIIESSSTMNVKVLRSFADFCAEADLKEHAMMKLMQLPAEKYTSVAYGQLTTFLGFFTQDVKKEFDTYLSSNNLLVGTINRTAKLNSIKNIK